MGNALSNSNNNAQPRPKAKAQPKSKAKPKQQQWAWEFKDGRAYIKPRGQATAKAPPRPLFRKQPSDNYEWWIFNPDPPKRSNSVKSNSGRRRG